MEATHQKIDLNNLTIPKKSKVDRSPNRKTVFLSAEIPKKKRAENVLKQSPVAGLDSKIPKKRNTCFDSSSPKSECKINRSQCRSKDVNAVLPKTSNNSRQPPGKECHRERPNKDGARARLPSDAPETKPLNQKTSKKKKRPRDEKMKSKAAIQQQEGQSQEQISANEALHTATAKKQPRKRKASTKMMKKREEGGAMKRGMKEINQKQRKVPKVSHQSEPEVKQLPQNTDVYPKHRRELERSLDRLEKSDQFGFFLDLPEIEDDFEPTICPDSIGLDLGLSRNRSKAVASLLNTGSSPAGETASSEECKFSCVVDGSISLPPKSFPEVREWVKRGRYEADRQSLQNRKASNLAKKLGKKVRDLIGVDANFNVPNQKSVDWEKFRDDIFSMCDTAIRGDPCGTAGKSGTIGHSALKLRELMQSIYDRAAPKQLSEIEAIEIRRQYRDIFDSNTEAAVQGDWRTTPFPERQYDRLQQTFSLCTGLSKIDKKMVRNDLSTNLPEGFYGMPYSFDLSGKVSESWMNSVAKSLDEKRKRRKDYDPKTNEIEISNIIRAQVSQKMETMLVTVQDRILSRSGTLTQHELCPSGWEKRLPYIDSGPSAVVEQAVWGVDRYTTRNVITSLGMEYAHVATCFVESWLLPAINACSPDQASDIMNALRFLEGKPPKDDRDLTIFGKILLQNVKETAPEWLGDAVRKVKNANSVYEGSAFCIHPKGHGVVVIKSEGLKAGTLVTHYLGELYPSWRWGEKMDAIEATQQRLGMRPALADFYNMTLERPKEDARGYGLLFVDASRKAGWASALSHSCNPTCQVQIVSKDGKLSLAMTTVRDVAQGHELTFDYNAVTESLNEYQQAVCLCGHDNCRGSFLHFATADCYQEVMRLKSPIAVRFTLLARACKTKTLTSDHIDALERHGFGTSVFGAASLKEDNEDMENVPIWLRMFAAEVLLYIEYERKTLPLKLISNQISSIRAAIRRKKSSEQISYLAADQEGRMHMEQRIQSLAQTLSLVGRVLAIHRLSVQSHDIHSPLSILSDQNVIDQIWRNSDSVVCELLGVMKADPNIGRSFVFRIEAICRRFSFLNHKFEKTSDACIARRYLKRALIDLRKLILSCGDKLDPSQRGKFHAAADLLLLYAYTRTFFNVHPYVSFESIPIDVYARELGNDVPRAKVELARRQRTVKSSVKILKCKELNVHGDPISECYEPEEAVASVARKYGAEYVLTQLLHWFNGGIGTKPGLSDMMGCIYMPSLASWWFQNDDCSVYTDELSSVLQTWLENRKGRGNPWPKALENFFSRQNIMVGSPALDFTLTGDETGVNHVVAAMKKSKEEAKETSNSMSQIISVDGDDKASESNQTTCSSSIEAIENTSSKANPSTDKDEASNDEDEPCFGCICGIAHPPPIEVFWIQCDGCQAWYNVASVCVGFGEKAANNLATWNCWACKLTGSRAKQDKVVLEVPVCP
mmetsp:Transcript_25700/g.39822  ORF Transcript_25700/g.39822 Transcript_25700/m.39822 type:complete len:1457 (+) Transcript_25700:106-4476(+)|eukprot:CAMPEP_0196823690 /NCGR_PEP_ID=MMETSP1362-20130617/88528_1 /TAXON_ID=163516 /ORGANISM="Leptocylindrus danicus, Strain CCMP1856" /LENGTH=1456 /DNA_ID=CAMNT_0042203657 /DNA_START=71 /DNA_END=4441 /DNA_ORIENTATION=+